MLQLALTSNSSYGHLIIVDSTKVLPLLTFPFENEHLNHRDYQFSLGSKFMGYKELEVFFLTLTHSKYLYSSTYYVFTNMSLPNEAELIIFLVTL